MLASPGSGGSTVGLVGGALLLLTGCGGGNDTAPRPSRVSAEHLAHCQHSWLAAGPIEPGALVQALMAAPLCMLTSMIRRESDPLAAAPEP